MMAGIKSWVAHQVFAMHPLSIVTYCKNNYSTKVWHGSYHHNFCGHFKFFANNIGLVVVEILLIE
jgi:hypothetical protein